jgi:integrase
MPYKRGKKWVGKIEIGGKPIYCGTHDTKTAARSAEEVKRRQLAGRNLGGMETCGSFAERWPRDYIYGRGTNRKRRKSTLEHYAERVSTFIDDPEFRDVPLVEVTRPMAMRYAREHPQRARTVAVMFSDAYNDGLISNNHWTRLGIPDGRDEKPVMLTLEEMKHAAEVCEQVHGPEYGPRFRAMFEFACWTGRRPAELFAMERSWLHPTEHKLEVNLQTYRDGTQDTPKNHKTPTVVLPDQAIEAIQNLPMRMDGLLFSQKRGKPMNQGALQRDWQRVRDVIGRSDLTWYEATKHFCGSQLALAGVSSKEIGHQLGHTDDGDTARRHYIHLYPSETHDRVLAGFRARSNVRPLRTAETAAEGA